jgi:hypothetical protein
MIISAMEPIHYITFSVSVPLEKRQYNTVRLTKSWKTRVRFLIGAEIFLFKNVDIGSRAHSVSYPMVISHSFPRDKVSQDVKLTI